MNLEVARTILLKHSRSDQNGIFPQLSTHSAKMTNPVCGDHVELKLEINDEQVIKAAGHKASACAICCASADILCHEIKEQTITNVLMMAKFFEQGIIESPEIPWPNEVKNLLCFEHLKVNPARKMCALLPWLALKNALRTS